MINLSERLNEILEERGMTRHELAVKADLSPQLIYKYTSGEVKDAFVGNIEKLCAALNVSPIDFLGWQYKTAQRFSSVPVYSRLPSSGAPSSSEICAHIDVKTDGDDLYAVAVEGAVAIVRRTNSGAPNDVCMVTVNGEDAIMRRVNFGMEGMTLTTLDGKDSETYEWADVTISEIRILGKVIELRVAL